MGDTTDACPCLEAISGTKEATEGSPPRARMLRRRPSPLLLGPPTTAVTGSGQWHTAHTKFPGPATALFSSWDGSREQFPPQQGTVSARRRILFLPTSKAAQVHYNIDEYTCISLPITPV